MANLGDLPAELLHTVSGYCKTGSLHALSLTSKRLNAITTQHLYRNCDIVLTGDRSSQLALTLYERPDLALLFESLSVSLRTASKKDVDRFTISEPRTEEDHALAEAHRRWHLIQSPETEVRNGRVIKINMNWEPYLPILLFKLCTNTRHLSLTLQWLDFAYDYPFTQSMPKLETLHIRLDRIDLRSLDGFEERSMYVERYTALRHLRALHFYGCDVMMDSKDALTSSMTIKELGLHHCDVTVGDLVAIFNTVKDLEVFEYSWLAEDCTESMMTSHGALHLLEDHKHTIRRLRLSLIQSTDGSRGVHHHSFFSSFAEPTALATYENLEHLDVEYMAFLLDPTIDWASIHLPEILSVPLTRILPRSIKSLVLRRCLGPVRRHLYQLIAGKDEPAMSWPHLETVHVEMWNAYTEASWYTLRKLFAERSVVLTVSAQQPEPWEDARFFQKDFCRYLDECMEEHEWQVPFET